jgi:hypothetical protein
MIPQPGRKRATGIDRIEQTSTIDRVEKPFIPVKAVHDFQVSIASSESGNGTVVVMIVDRAVHSSSDNNGSGDPRTVVADLSA